jgi:erythromycin esterase-like protein
MHVAHGLPAVRGVGAPASVYEKYLVQGDVIHRELGDDAYTILFTAARGAAGSVFETRETPLLEPLPGSLEDLFDRAGASCAFLDFRAARGVDGSPWSSPMIARPFGYGVMEGDWTKVADAFVYTAEMTPSRPRRAPAR